jgi:hypothetical protein
MHQVAGPGARLAKRVEDEEKPAIAAIDDHLGFPAAGNPWHRSFAAGHSPSKGCVMIRIIPGLFRLGSAMNRSISRIRSAVTLAKSLRWRLSIQRLRFALDVISRSLIS